MKIVPVLDVNASEIVELWNECLGSTFPMTEALWIQNTVREPNVIHEGSIAIYDEQQLLGFVVAKQYKESTKAKMSDQVGWIQCLLVRKSKRNQGIGTALVTHANNAFTNVSEIRLGRDPWHYFPGIPLYDDETIQYFESKGFKKDSIEVDLVRDVKGSTHYTLTNSQAHYRLLTAKDIPALLTFLETAFPGRWHYEALRYAELQATGREFMGFFIEGELKGFCRVNDINSPVIAQNVYWSNLFTGTVGGIGPLGIDRNVRGTHFGLDLVKAAANELISRGVDHIVIDWTQLVDFYGKIRFVPWKKYQTMSKGV